MKWDLKDLKNEANIEKRTKQYVKIEQKMKKIIEQRKNVEYLQREQQQQPTIFIKINCFNSKYFFFQKKKTSNIF